MKLIYLPKFKLIRYPKTTSKAPLFPLLVWLLIICFINIVIVLFLRRKLVIYRTPICAPFLSSLSISHLHSRLKTITLVGLQQLTDQHHILNALPIPSQFKHLFRFYLTIIYLSHHLLCQFSCALTLLALQDAHAWLICDVDTLISARSNILTLLNMNCTESGVKNYPCKLIE